MTPCWTSPAHQCGDLGRVADAFQQQVQLLDRTRPWV